MEKKRASAAALGAFALLAAAGSLLGGGARPAARHVLSVAAAVAAPAPAEAESVTGTPAGAVVAAAPLSGSSRLASPPVPALPAAGPGQAVGAGGPVDTPTASAVVAADYGNVAVHTRAGRRYMAVVADPLAGLGALPAGWTAAAHTVAVGGLTRVYLTVAPTALSGSVPVVVLMHGVIMTATQILNLTQLAAQTGPAIIVAPQGWEQSWNAGGCCGAAYRAGIDDVGFIRSALQQVLAANPAADPSRVYAVGFSNGGRMAYRLACDLPGVFAGFAAAEAVPVQNCSSLHPLSILIIAQQSDPLLTVDADRPPKWTEGVAEPTVAAVVAKERAMDGCVNTPTVTYTGVAERSSWNCAAGTRLTYVWYPGGSHSWRAPIGATPGSTDMVLSLMGGQLLAGRSVYSSSVDQARLAGARPASGSTTVGPAPAQHQTVSPASSSPAASPAVSPAPAPALVSASVPGATADTPAAPTYTADGNQQTSSPTGSVGTSAVPPAG